MKLCSSSTLNIVEIAAAFASFRLNIVEIAAGAAVLAERVQVGIGIWNRIEGRLQLLSEK